MVTLQKIKDFHKTIQIDTLSKNERSCIRMIYMSCVAEIESTLSHEFKTYKSHKSQEETITKQANLINQLNRQNIILLHTIENQKQEISTLKEKLAENRTYKILFKWFKNFFQQKIL